MHTYLLQPVECDERVQVLGLPPIIVRSTGKTLQTPHGIISKYALIRWADGDAVKFGFACNFVKCSPVGQNDLETFCVVTRIWAPCGGKWLAESDAFVWLPASAIQGTVPYYISDGTGQVYPLRLQ